MEAGRTTARRASCVVTRLLAALVVTICVVSVLATRPARAFEVDLQGGVFEERDARAPLLLIVRDAPPESLARLLVEIDRVDVTALAQLAGSEISVAAAEPLAPGPHELRLLENMPGVGVEERGTWVFSVAESAGFVLDSANARVGASGSVRVAEDEPPGPQPDRAQSNGGLDGAVSVSRGTLGFDASGAAFYDTVEQNLGGQEADLGPFLAEVRAPHVALRYGHQAVGPPTLAMQDFERRGASGTLTTPWLQTSLDAFALEGSPVIGTHGSFGVDDPEDRVWGVALRSRPVDARVGTLDFSGVFVDGTAAEAGSDLSGVSGDPVKSDGTAWSTRLDGQLSNGRLGGFGEYAQSRFDSDGPGGLGARSDDARRIGLHVTPFPGFSWREQPVLLDLDLEDSAIGTYFRSPANPGAPQDRHIQSALLHAARAGFDVQASFAREEDNVNHVSELPRLRSDLVWVDASYTPFDWAQEPAPRLAGWLGVPTLRVYYSHEHLDPTRVPAAMQALAAAQGVNSLLPDQVAQTGYAGVTFAKSDWSWQLGQRVIDTDSASDSFPSSRTWQTEFSASVPIGARVSLAPYLSVDETQSPGLPRVLSILGGGQLGVVVLPETLSLHVDASAADTASSRGTGAGDGHVYTASGGLDWIALSESPRLPGLLLSLLGTWQQQEFDAIPGSADDLYQIFVQATLSWSRNWGR